MCCRSIDDLGDGMAGVDGDDVINLHVYHLPSSLYYGEPTCRKASGSPRTNRQEHCTAFFFFISCCLVFPRLNLRSLNVQK